MAFTHRFDPTVLREYDIRGIVGATLHAADAHAIGQAFGTMVVAQGGKRVVLEQGLADDAADVVFAQDGGVETVGEAHRARLTRSS